MPKNYVLFLSYNGKNYYGWNPQPNKKTIISTLEEALNKFYNVKFKIVGSGRTDAGVHALEQVANVVLDIPYEPLILQKILNNHLPNDILINDIKIAFNIEFNARFNCLNKTYLYQMKLPSKQNPLFHDYYWIYNFKNLDFEIIRKGINFFIQKTNFRSFSTAKAKELANKSQIREIFFIKTKIKNDILEWEVNGSGFLRHMVRKIIATLVALGEHKISIEKLKRILDACSPREGKFKAPPSGLYLKQVFYEKNNF